MLRIGAAGVDDNPYSLSARSGILTSDVSPGVGYRLVEVDEEVLLMPERVEHPDRSEQLLVAGLHPLDQHGHPPALERGDDVAQDAGPGRIDQLQLRHPEYHDRDTFH